MIEQEGGISILGDITPQKEDTLLAYTINISPNEYINGQKWGETLPDDQVKFLKRIHHKIFYRLWTMINEDDELNGNEVCFEFTKAGEIHSHGYYRLFDKFIGYERYIQMLTKLIKSHISKSKYSVIVKWADNGWIDYIHKEDGKNGYRPYSTQYCETIKKDITYWL